MKIEEGNIKSVTIVTSEGVKMYVTAGLVQDKVIAYIIKAPIHITGEPFDHYVGFDKEHNMLFSVNPACPCVVEYY